MPTPTKVNEDSYKVKNALDDIQQKARIAQAAIDELEPVVRSRRNEKLTGELLKLRKAVDTMYLLALHARRGEYFEM